MHVRQHGGRPTWRRWLAIVTSIALLTGVLAGIPAAVLAVTPAAASTSAPPNFVYACGARFTPGKARCTLIENTAAHPAARAVLRGTTAIPAGVGYGPSDLQSAYSLASASATDGAGMTVAVIDAYHDPNAASDLAAYRAAAGQPALKQGQFNVYNQEGQTSPLPGPPPSSGFDWTRETSVDIEMVSAICPLCNIDLVEAGNDHINSDGSGDLFTADQTAATMLGARYISDSWGEYETSTLNFTSFDAKYFGVRGVVYTAASGDGGYVAGGQGYPAASPNVVSVGGTTLNTASGSRLWTESVWYSTTESTAGPIGTGSGCSLYEPQPSWQKSISSIAAACPKRVDNDVAADADPATGVAYYDTANGNTGWLEAGGTSVSSPIIAAVFALARNDGNGGNNAANSIYSNTGGLYEVTGGSNGTCTPPAADSVLCTATGAAKTYNGPTGWGTPNGITAFESIGNTVTVTWPGDQTGTVGTAISNLQISATDSASSTLTYTATGLPAGLSISSAGLISGTPTAAGTNQVTVTATDTSGGSGSATFIWTIGNAGGSGNTITVTSPGNQTGTVGTAISDLQIAATDSDSSQTLIYSASGLPAGLSISSGGVISGTPTTGGTDQVTVEAADTTGATGSASFTWTISGGGNAGNKVTVYGPGSQDGIVGVPASLQILATDSDSDETLTYSATGLPAGLSMNSSTGLISGTPTTAGTSDVRITVTDTTGATGFANSAWTISPVTTTVTGCTARQLLGNGGFDTGSIKPWSATAGVLAKSGRGLRPQAGNWLAWLDGYYGAAHTDTVAQKVTIPSTCKNAVFTYWTEVHTNVANKTQQKKNTLVLEILNASGKVIKSVLVATAANHATKYWKHTRSLASYIGKTITIKFIGTEAGGGNTGFLEDSNALNVW